MLWMLDRGAAGRFVGDFGGNRVRVGVGFKLLVCAERTSAGTTKVVVGGGTSMSASRVLSQNCRLS